MTELLHPALNADAPAGAASVLSAADAIRDLARRHGVAYAPSGLDAFAADASRLSDAEVAPDDVENLLQALTRAGVITHRERFALHAAYLGERDAG